MQPAAAASEPAAWPTAMLTDAMPYSTAGGARRKSHVAHLRVAAEPMPLVVARSAGGARETGGAEMPMSARSEGSAPTYIEEDSGSSDEGSVGDLKEDAETVWSPDIENAFMEALRLYPPCGRRKIILNEDGGLYGRNELISRYIFKQTGKKRSRKQVSSHIQVLTRKMLRGRDSNLRFANLRIETPSQSFPPLMPIGGSVCHSVTPSSSILTPPLTSANASSVSPRHLKGDVALGAGIPVGPPRPAHTSVATSPHPAAVAMAANVELLSSIRTGIAANHMNPVVVLSGFSIFTADPGAPDPSNRIYLLQPQSLPSSASETERIEICQVADKFFGLVDLVANQRHAAFYLLKCWAVLGGGASGSAAAGVGDHGGDNGEAGVSENGGALCGATFQFTAQARIRTLGITTTVCSFGGLLAQRTTQLDASFTSNGLSYFQFDVDPLCPSVMTLVTNLLRMNSVQAINEALDSVTVSQVVFRPGTCEVYLSLSYVFAVSDFGASHCNVYRLVLD